MLDPSKTRPWRRRRPPAAAPTRIEPALCSHCGMPIEGALAARRGALLHPDCVAAWEGNGQQR